jgi:divalent metal cation (Fe/Co/Zn/Cd) transporter
MNTVSLTFRQDKESLFRWALGLALFTVIYNVLEGVVSVYFGIDDETIALFGFGLDSFGEVISGVGIWDMIDRYRRSGDSGLDRFEKRALHITGAAFYLLTGGLTVSALVNVIRGHAPVTTLWGVVVAAVSILTMWLLFRYKVIVGKKLGSPAILSDANCTKTCMYLSAVLLICSAGYEMTGIGGLDSAGALLIAWFSFKEGREAFEKARQSGVCSCGGGCSR